MNALRVMGGRVRAGYWWLEDKPIVVVLVAATATVAVAVVLASYTGIPHVWRLVQSRHNWPWLLGCLIGELVAYGGYVLTVRHMALVDDGNEVGITVSAKTVVAGLASLPPPDHRAVLPSITGLFAKTLLPVRASCWRRFTSSSVAPLPWQRARFLLPVGAKPASPGRRARRRGPSRALYVSVVCAPR